MLIVIEDLRINICLLSHVVDLDVLLHGLDLFRRLASTFVFCAVLALIYCEHDDIESFRLPICPEINTVPSTETSTHFLVVEGHLLEVGRTVDELNCGVAIELLSLVHAIGNELEVIVVHEVDLFASATVFGPESLIKRVVVLAHVQSGVHERLLVHVVHDAPVVVLMVDHLLDVVFQVPEGNDDQANGDDAADRTELRYTKSKHLHLR